MDAPHDRESLLAAWEAIGPSQPFPDELQGLCLAYFKSSKQHDNSETNGVMTPTEDEEFHSPPTRYVRQLRANKRAPPGPVRVEDCADLLTESVRPGSLSTTSYQVELCAEMVANGPEDDRVLLVNL